jgi:hypothetical protein
MQYKIDMRTKQKFISISPLSSKAKIRFTEEMNCFHSCKIVNETDDMFYLSSLNNQYFFWCPKQGNQHWKVEK